MFGELLRRLRAAAGLSQAALAERAGLSERGISDLERGVRRMPFPETLQLLARALEVPVSEFSAVLGAPRTTRASTS
jgi:transcriptional regulator with XRE-family HTH domain